MEIKITKTAPGEYDSCVSFEGTPEDVVRESLIALNAIGNAMVKQWGDKTVKRFYLFSIAGWIGDYFEKEYTKHGKRKNKKG